MCNNHGWVVTHQLPNPQTVFLTIATQNVRNDKQEPGRQSDRVQRVSRLGKEPRRPTKRITGRSRKIQEDSTQKMLLTRQVDETVAPAYVQGLTRWTVPCPSQGKQEPRNESKTPRRRSQTNGPEVPPSSRGVDPRNRVERPPPINPLDQRSRP